MFALAIDATAIIPTLRVWGDRIVGLATEDEVVVSTAQEIIDIVNNKDFEKAKQANSFMSTPLQEHIPAFVLAVAPVYKGQDHALVRHWINQVTLWGGCNDIMVIGLGADGDSKVRKYYVETFKKSHGKRNDVINIDNESLQFSCVVEDLTEMDVAKQIPTLMFPDWRNLIKKWRNQILNVRRVLVLGKGVVQIEHLMKTYEMKRIRSALWKSDVFVKDKQKVDAALRILQDEVRICMKEWKDEETVATRVSLKMGRCSLSSYTQCDMSVKERTKLAWASVVFLRYWKAWTQISGYSVENYFISSQTFDDSILSGHSIILR